MQISQSFLLFCFLLLINHAIVYTFHLPVFSNVHLRHNLQMQELTYSDETIIPINDQITAPIVRLIVPSNSTKPTDQGIMAGIFTLEEAKLQAEKYNLDLMLINEKADPPVCKLMNYSKFKYQKERKDKEKLKNNTKQETKEVKMNYCIDQHDFDVRARAVQKFLLEGAKTKIVIQFKGREAQYRNKGQELLDKILLPVKTIAIIDKPSTVEGSNLVMVLSPKKT